MHQREVLRKIFVGIFAFAFMPCLQAAESFTVARFHNPSQGSNTPLFTVNWSDMTVSGSWNSPGLTLVFGDQFGGDSFENVRLEMTDLALIYTQSGYGPKFGMTDSGQINFYQQGTITNPLMTIDFDGAYISRYVLAEQENIDNNVWAQNVTFSGSQFESPLTNQQFSFAFANVTALPGGTMDSKGFTATASFDSSAVPEPATIALLGLGAIVLIKKRNNKVFKSIKLGTP